MHEFDDVGVPNGSMVVFARANIEVPRGNFKILLGVKGAGKTLGELAITGLVPLTGGYRPSWSQVGCEASGEPDALRHCHRARRPSALVRNDGFGACWVGRGEDSRSWVWSRQHKCPQT